LPPGFLYPIMGKCGITPLCGRKATDHGPKRRATMTNDERRTTNRNQATGKTRFPNRRPRQRRKQPRYDRKRVRQPGCNAIRFPQRPSRLPDPYTSSITRRPDQRRKQPRPHKNGPGLPPTCPLRHIRPAYTRRFRLHWRSIPPTTRKERMIDVYLIMSS
jgi:hypothetical protein